MGSSHSRSGKKNPKHDADIDHEDDHFILPHLEPSTPSPFPVPPIVNTIHSGRVLFPLLNETLFSHILPTLDVRSISSLSRCSSDLNRFCEPVLSVAQSNRATWFGKEFFKIVEEIEHAINVHIASRAKARLTRLLLLEASRRPGSSFFAAQVHRLYPVHILTEFQASEEQMLRDLARFREAMLISPYAPPTLGADLLRFGSHIFSLTLKHLKELQANAVAFLLSNEMMPVARHRDFWECIRQNYPFSADAQPPSSQFFMSVGVGMGWPLRIGLITNALGRAASAGSRIQQELQWASAELQRLAEETRAEASAVDSTMAFD